jgi:hypothetical protein
MTRSAELENSLRRSIAEAMETINTAKKRMEGYDAELAKLLGVPESLGQKNMIDPADADIYSGEGGPMIRCVDCIAEHCSCVAR